MNKQVICDGCLNQGKVEGKYCPLCRELEMKAFMDELDNSAGEAVIDPSRDELAKKWENKMKATRHNEGKPKWSILHYKSLIPLVQVLEFGAEKYDRDNWKKEMDPTEILDSLTRHLTAIIDGEECDQESGLPHIGHIMANAMFYSYHKK